jgi:predicted membrane protein
MNTSNQNRTLGIGIFIILAGLAILLHQLRFFSPEIDDVIISWQMLLIVIGAYNLLFAGNKIAGYILIAIGGFFIIPELFILPYDFKRNFWPVLLIVVGLIVLFRAFPGRKREPAPPLEGNPMEYIEEVNIFSGSERKITTENFRGGKITSLFGGSELDLSSSRLAEGNNVLEVFYMFGGSSITVPRDWTVINKVTSILGGFSDKRYISSSTTDNPKGILIIQGFVMFGGGEIKSL